MDTKLPLTFFAEIVETKQTKSVSLDSVYSLRLRTDNNKILDLGKLPADVVVKVTIDYGQS